MKAIEQHFHMVNLFRVRRVNSHEHIFRVWSHVSFLVHVHCTYHEIKIGSLRFTNYLRKKSVNMLAGDDRSNFSFWHVFPYYLGVFIRVSRGELTTNSSFIRSQSLAYWPAVRMILPTWFDQLVGNVQNVLLARKISWRPTKNVNETPDIISRFFHPVYRVRSQISWVNVVCSFACCVGWTGKCWDEGC